jgi:hypothetical protein
MEDTQPTSTNEFAGKEVKESPENTIDLQKFQKSLAAQDDNPVPQITWREVKALKRSRYFDVKDNFDTAYVIQNRKTGAIAEIQAASTVHAANFIGWRPKQVRLLETVNVQERQKKFAKELEKYEDADVDKTSGSSD